MNDLNSSQAVLDDDGFALSEKSLGATCGPLLHTKSLATDGISHTAGLPPVHLGLTVKEKMD
jgi:hypothetical protein